jgi:hypothetical protein
MLRTGDFLLFIWFCAFFKWTSLIGSVTNLVWCLQSLLCDPNPNSPANSEAARLFSENKREYNHKVREIVKVSWTAEWCIAQTVHPRGAFYNQNVVTKIADSAITVVLLC